LAVVIAVVIIATENRGTEEENRKREG